MEEVVKKKSAAYYIAFISGILAIIFCFTSIGLSVSNNFVALYTLFVAITLLGINRIGLHLSNFKKNIIENIFVTCFIFVIALLVSFTKYSIYFLTSALFCYCITIIGFRILKLKEDHSIQSIVFNVLCIILSFLMSFVFFFPAIYAKHATSVSNSNFIVMCFSFIIIVSSSKNLIFPYHHFLKLDVVSRIIKKSLVYEILMILIILIILCSVYFTVVEPNITSYVDSLWYSFSVITTIGFGDVPVVTTFGRILSVILGISGIVVVALVTSFIVNFYNEMSRRRDEATLEKILDEEKKLKETIEEQKKEK